MIQFSTCQLRAMGCHLEIRITCHASDPTQVNTPRLNPSQTGWYLIYVLQRDGSWKAETK